MSVTKYLFILFFASILSFVIGREFFNHTSQFDLRDHKQSTSAKKQSWGTCWAHGTFAAMESSMIKTKIWEISGEVGEPDLSEYHLDKFNGFNRNGEKGDLQKGWYSGQDSSFEGSNLDNLNNGLVVHLGGDYRMAAAYLSNTLGAVQEKKTPTISHLNNDHDKFGNNKNSGVLFENEYQYYFPTHVEWLSLEGSKLEKRKKIKQAIKLYGAVASTQFKDDAPVAIASDGLEIHYGEKEYKLNHSIALIGWNDDIEWKDKKGAWLVKDSDHKNEKTNEHLGHFYIMYDDYYTASDKFMGGVIFRDVKLREKGTQIYSHSLHGWRYTTDENFHEVANKFKSTRNEKLHAVGIYTVKEDSNFMIHIYKNGKKILSQWEKESRPGFHYINLKRQVSLKDNDEFMVSLEYKTNGYAYDATFSMDVLMGKLPKWGDPVLVKSKAKKGESVYRKLARSSWSDFSDYSSKKNKQKNLKKELQVGSSNFSINAYTIE